MEVLQGPPSASSFIPLAEHQSRTPQSFYDGPPVLYYHSARCKVVVLESDLSSSPALNNLRKNVPAVNGSTGAADQSQEGKEVVIDGVEIFVTSEKFLLYQSEANAGIALPYPLISLHAIQRLRLPNTPENEDEVQGLYMQIAKPSPTEGAGMEEDEEEDSIALTIVPPSSTQATTVAPSDSEASGVSAAGEQAEAAATSEESPTQLLFAAVSACSNLHPDPIGPGEEGGDDDEFDEDYEGSTERSGLGGQLQNAGLIIPGATDGGLPPPVDGSSGWITVENMHEYFDEDGNWIADGEPPGSMTLPGLGAGAGHVHDRTDEDQLENGDGAGESNGAAETKWRRTD